MNQPARFQIFAFKAFVPHPVRIALLVLFTVIFQCSNTVYLTLTGTLVGANQLVKEDLTFAYQVTMTGICFVFPLLFRFKLRFTSQQIIIGTAILSTAMMWISIHTNSVPLLALCSFVLGAAKMLGTFEALTSIQLIITPNKDYGVFFSVALGIVLLCGQLSGIWAIYLTYDYDWTVIYKILMVANAVMILLALLFFRNIRIVKKLPLYGIDWLGLFLWSSLFISLTFVFAYGQLLNWWHDERIQLALTLSIVFSLLTLIRLFTVRRPYISARVFALKNVWVAILLMFLLQIFLGTSGSVLSPFTSGVLHLDELTNSSLNGWVALGILVGAGFSYQWFLRLNGPFSVFFGIAFLSLTLYHLAIYFVLSSYADASVLAIPYWLRGFGQMLLFAGTAKYVTNQIGMDIFTQVLCFMAMIRNSLGSLIPSALIGYWEYFLALDYQNKLASKIDMGNVKATALYQSVYGKGIQTGGSSMDATLLASKTLFARVNQQAVLLAGRDIFGAVTILGLLVMILILTIHFVHPFIRRIPSWEKVRLDLSKNAVE